MSAREREKINDTKNEIKNGGVEAKCLMTSCKQGGEDKNEKYNKNILHRNACLNFMVFLISRFLVSN